MVFISTPLSFFLSLSRPFESFTFNFVPQAATLYISFYLMSTNGLQKRASEQERERERERVSTKWLSIVETSSASNECKGKLKAARECERKFVQKINPLPLEQIKKHAFTVRRDGREWKSELTPLAGALFCVRVHVASLSKRQATWQEMTRGRERERAREKRLNEPQSIQE